MKRVMLMMVLAALLLTQCKKPSIDFPTPSETTTVSMTITAGPGSKTDINGTTGAITWSAGDKIYVGDGSKYVGFLTLVGDGGDATGTFTGDVTVATGTYTFHFYYLGSTATPAANATDVTVDFSSQNIYADNGKLKNASGQHVGYGKAEHVKVEADKPVTGLQVSMKSKVAIAYFCFQKGEGVSATPYEGALTLSGDHIYNKMTVNFSGARFACEGTNDGITLEAGHAERYVMLVPTGTDSETLNFGGAYEGTTTLANGIEANKFYRIDGSMPIVVKVEKVKPFTVGMDDNDKPIRVEFSPGNLYYDGTTDNKWKFEANQYDFRTYNGKGSCINGTYSSSIGTPANDWGLFGWSGSTGSAEYGKSTSTNNDYYSGDFKDWGGITDLPDNAGGEPWRTLSIAEWEYLLDTRTTNVSGITSNARYAEVKVNGVCGMMLFPDSFTWPSDVTTKPTTFNTYSSTWNDGVNYTTADFGKLESHGAVFLPVAGYRQGGTVYYVGSGGYYWTSTPSMSSKAYGMYFASGYVYTTEHDLREYGMAVRLVR